MIDLFQTRNFRLLWVASLLSSIGDTILLIAMPFYLYQQTGSAKAIGLVFIVEMIPRLIISAPAGVFVDRWNKVQTMIVCDVLRALLMGILTIVALYPEYLSLLFPVCFMTSGLQQFFGPAGESLIPEVAGIGRMQNANALGSIANNLNRVVGPFAGGMVIVYLGFAGTVLINALTFVASATLLHMIRDVGTKSEYGQDILIQEKHNGDNESSRIGNVLAEWRSGVRLIGNDRIISVVFICMALLMVGQGFLNIALAPFVYNVLRDGPVAFAWIASAQGIGGLIGAAFVGKLGQLLPARLLVGISASISGSIMYAMYSMTSLPIIVVLSCLAGIPTALFLVSMSTLVLMRSPTTARGRIQGSLQTVQAAFLITGLVVCTVLIDSLGEANILRIMSLFILSAGILALSIMPKSASFQT
ncbi:MAG: MFS transporter [Thermomicrobiales bacterium]